MEVILTIRIYIEPNKKVLKLLKEGHWMDSFPKPFAVVMPFVTEL